MHQEHHRWHSPALGRPMDVAVYGHAGAKLLVFPTSLGTYREWPDRRMHMVLRDHLENGWVQMYCVHHVHEESWYNKKLHPGARAWRQRQYLRYLHDEVIPLTYARNPNDFVIAAGASFGAYHAAAFGLTYPDVVKRIIGMSGRYDITHMTGGYTDPNVNATNPFTLASQERDPARIDAFRRQDIIIAIGDGDPAVEDNRAFSATLWDRGIGNALRIWKGFAHDWPYWERMIRLYIGGHD